MIRFLNSNLKLYQKHRILLNCFRDIHVTPLRLANTEVVLPNSPADTFTSTINEFGEVSFVSLGLNNYTPVGGIQYLIENMHNYLELPWWSCIITTMLIIRTMMIPLLVWQHHNLGNLLKNSTEQQNLIYEALKAKDDNDPILMMAKLKEKGNTGKNSGVLNFVTPIAIQGSLFFTMFIGIRQIANSTLPSFTNGGIAWFTNLSIHDPYFILPILSATSIYLIMTREQNIKSSQMNSTLTWFTRILPFGIFLLTSHFPSALTLYWASSNFYSLMMSSILHRPWTRTLLNLPDISKYKVHNPNNYKIADFINLSRELQTTVIRDHEESKRWREEQSNRYQLGKEAMAKMKKEMKK